MAAKGAALRRRASVANTDVFDVSMQMRPHSTVALRRRSLTADIGDIPGLASKSPDDNILVVGRRRQSMGDAGFAGTIRRCQSHDSGSEDFRTSISPKRGPQRRGSIVEGTSPGTRGKQDGHSALMRRRSIVTPPSGSPKASKGWNRLRQSLDDGGETFKKISSVASTAPRANTRKVSPQKELCKDEYKDCCMYGDASALKKLKDKDVELYRTTAVGWGLAEIAASYGNVEALELLWEKKVDLDKVTSDGHTALTAAARSGQSESVKYILRHVSLQRSGKHAKPSIPPLSWAAMYGHLDIVSRLLVAKADVNEPDMIDRPPVMWAAMHGHLAVVKHLVESRAQIDCAYCKALCDQHNEAVEFLNLANKRNFQLLRAARAANLHDVRKAILVNEANVDAQDEDGWTALMWGVVADSFDIIAFLVSSGANLEIQNDDGFTAKELAQNHTNKWTDVAQYFETLSWANTNIIKGARFGDTNLVRSCISARGCVNSMDELNWGPIHWASNRGDVSVIRMLVEAKASIESKDGDGHTPFLICALFGHLNCIKRMTDKLRGLHPNVRARTKENEGAIELAAKGGQAETLIWLMEYYRSYKKDVKECLAWEDLWLHKGELYNDVASALLSASSLGHLEVVKAIGTRKFDLSMKSDFWGWDDEAFALLIASRHGHQSIVQYLLSSAGSDINDADSEGRTPLFWAVRNNRDSIMDMLIDCSADVNCVTRGGFTLLHAAALAGSRDACQTLIAKHCDVNIKTQKDKLTPLDCAKEGGHVELQDFLEFFTTGGTDDKWRPTSVRCLNTDKLGGNSGKPRRSNTSSAWDGSTVVRKSKKLDHKAPSFERTSLRVDTQSQDRHTASTEKLESRESLKKEEKSLNKEKLAQKKEEKSGNKEKSTLRGTPTLTKSLSKPRQTAQKTICAKRLASKCEKL